MIQPITWQCRHFDQLPSAELYQMLRLRAEVFVVGQQCAYQDLDGKDLQSYHLTGRLAHRLVAYARLLAPGISGKEPSIGRVVVPSAARGTGLGRELMERSIEECYSLFGRQSIKIGAQLYLKNFYASLGFVPCGEVYDEIGIAHIKMTLAPP